MQKRWIFFLYIYLLPSLISAQEKSDTFFLANKKGLLGKIGRSISTDPQVIMPAQSVNPFLEFEGKTIGSIDIVGLGLNRNINDSVNVNNTFILRLANALHKNTREKFIKNNLFFKEGGSVIPLLFSDNERYLREQDYLQDARIIILPDEFNEEIVNVVVIVRDVFSLGGSASVSSLSNMEMEIKEENLNGMGNRLSIYGLYDKARTPNKAFGAELLKRNINGNFFDWKAGFKTFNTAYSSLKKEETTLYTTITRPLVSRYTRWTGALELAYNKSQDNYHSLKFDSVYRYSYLRTDLWGGYNIGARRLKMTDNPNRLRHFVAIRTFYTRFHTRPLMFQNTFNYNYADINGVLFAYTLFKQNFYRTNFIYGFGRNEDVPVGLNLSATTGYTNKDGKKRNYFGLAGEGNKYTRAGKFYGYTLRVGAFSFRNHFEDIDMLAGFDHFTAIKNLGKNWRNRNFVNISSTKQHNHLLSPPLFLQSQFGLPYYNNGAIEGIFRTTIKAEAVFFNMRKLAGFRFAPFLVAGSSFITPVGESFTKTNGYNAVGGGIRTRNESLILGTVEAKAYYLTRMTFPGMKSWKIEFSTKLRFKYNSNFITRPDFVNSN